MFSLLFATLLGIMAQSEGPVPLRNPALVAERAVLAPAIDNAVTMILERPAKRKTEKLALATSLPENGDAIVLAVRPAKDQAPATALAKAPSAVLESLAALKPEGFRFFIDRQEARSVIWIVGADARGVLYGAGHLLRHLSGGDGNQFWVVGPSDVLTAPMYPLRGHQLGYRNRANSWDAWTVEQFDAHIRELAIFGTNAIENIPFQDDDKSPHMKYPREVMNVKMSEICSKYDLEYWVWIPADFDLTDASKRAEALERHRKFYEECPRLDAIFFPGGDPGDNPPELVIPFIADCAKLLQAKHKSSKVWLSLQGFREAKSKKVFEWLKKDSPDWFGGIVHGPSSPPIRWERQQLDPKYPIRSYPDITHTVRAQYPIYWWDPVFAFTLGRECINPTPVYQSKLHNWFAPYTNGFLSYSDGVHDDVNKCVWSALAWNPTATPREIAIEYARVFFGGGNPDKVDMAAFAGDLILALEKNWEGPLANNGAVHAVEASWVALQTAMPWLSENWRFQMCAMRAQYDAYQRLRLLDETAREQKAMACLKDAKTIGSAAAMKNALQAYVTPIGDPKAANNIALKRLRQQVEQRCDKLYELIVLQTSVPKYKASGYERGCSLDFIDYPLNNRWWLEDEFGRIAKFASETEKLDRLETIRTWENPGPGSYYDDVGNVAKSDHVQRSTAAYVDFLARSDPNTSVMWWDDGKSRKKPAWITYMDWPSGIVYDNIDMNAKYRIRTTGYNQCLMRINGERVQPIVDGKAIGEFKIFEVPEKHVKSGKLSLTFDRPDERHLNWRQHSRLCEIWLLKQ